MDDGSKREYMRAWRAANKERIATYKRERYEQERKDPSWREANRARVDAWKAANPEKYKANQESWRASHKDDIRQYHAARDAADLEGKKARRKADYEKNAERYQQQARAWREANVEQHKENKQAWKRANHGLVIAAVKLRKKYIKERTPAWADLKAIAAIYANCPAGYHVDHIIPLRGKTVSGLHIETNLQYLPGLENLRKHNTFK
jgi:hypothetical protein